MDNLEEMDKFLERYNLPRLNQEEIENMKRQITSTEIESLIKNSQQIEVQDQMASQGNSTTHAKKSYPSQTIPKNWRQGTTPKSFYEATITLIPKLDKDTTKKKKITGQYLW